MTGIPWLSFGESHALQVVVIEPLFEEANRCRKLVADFMRALDSLEIGCRIAELPGAGESEEPISQVSLAAWQQAASSQSQPFVASFRGGALIDGAVAGSAHWRFSPETGMRIMRDLRRAMLANGDGAQFAGHALTQVFADELEAALPLPVKRLRTVRLASDPAEADRRVEGIPLWRRAEPGEDPALARALASDLADWIRQCAAS